jgi:hypothetical protein
MEWLIKAITIIQQYIASMQKISSQPKLSSIDPQKHQDYKIPEFLEVTANTSMLLVIWNGRK